MTPSGALAFHVSSQRRINNYLWVHSRTSPLRRRTRLRAGHSSHKRKQYDHTSAYDMVHALAKFPLPTRREWCHSVSDSGGDVLLHDGSQWNLFPLRMGTALAQVPHSSF